MCLSTVDHDNVNYGLGHKVTVRQQSSQKWFSWGVLSSLKGVALLSVEKGLVIEGTCELETLRDLHCSLEISRFERYLIQCIQGISIIEKT